MYDIRPVPTSHTRLVFFRLIVTVAFVSTTFQETRTCQTRRNIDLTPMNDFKTFCHIRLFNEVQRKVIYYSMYVG